MRPRDPDGRAELAAYRAARQPDAQRRRHNWNETLARLGEDPLTDAKGPASSRAPRIWIGVAAAVIVALTGALLLGRGDPMHDTGERMPHSQAVDGETQTPAPATMKTRVPAPVERSMATKPIVAAPAPAIASEPARASDTPPRRRPTVLPAPEPAAITPERLALETDLIARARAAAVASDDALAIRLLRQHAREYPDGAMVEDRGAWLAIVQCRSSAPQDGREAAARFLAAHPRSPYAARVRLACADPKIE